MTGHVAAKLSRLGITLPAAPAPAANYVPFVVHGGLVHVSGQVSQGPDGLILGRMGDGMSLEDGKAAARACALSLLAQLSAACNGDLDRVVKVVRLGGFVNSTPDFTQQPEVINGASDLMVEVFGPQIGAHARAAVGCAALPRGVVVEVDGIFALR
ncbi:MAG: enamine deaminase RidA (YjgF/YER057c/UK114 family) [Paracoccaceae bacterium]|jgi:enamine deaminase RidA (YjgF/YER057c/UK114 family)